MLSDCIQYHIHWWNRESLKLPIQTFADKETLKVFKESYSPQAEKQLPKQHWDKAKNIMDTLDSAERLEDLRQYDLDQKTGPRSQQYSLSVNQQYRVLFEWNDGDVENVWVGDPDYH